MDGARLPSPHEADGDRGDPPRHARRACEPSPEGSEGTRSPALANADARHVVVDTDLAFDDIMALLYLLQRDDVVIDAVTIAGTGEAHCDPGVRYAIRLLALGGETDAPVACG